MSERPQKPFLTVKTGEAYQPIRLTYTISDKAAFEAILDNLACMQKRSHPNTWDWLWASECEELHFESLETFKKNTDIPFSLGTLMLSDHTLHVSLPSFKRACLAVSFFHESLDPGICRISRADFINKVFGLNERLPHGFTELFKDEELEEIVTQRIRDYETVLEKCEHATSANEAFSLLSEYASAETYKRLPYAERYLFDKEEMADPETAFLGFYVFLRSRELVAIRRWFGDTFYTLADVAEETADKAFGDMDIDIIE
ncbi:MAG TPA: hypothetical protein VNC84_01105 [Gammaproteobacteria bacterium]|jgi:hypothetical protein|nr:hypothetical protein [Gammaproteobacteria bacterium]